MVLSRCVMKIDGHRCPHFYRTVLGGGLVHGGESVLFPVGTRGVKDEEFGGTGVQLREVGDSGSGGNGSLGMFEFSILLFSLANIDFDSFVLLLLVVVLGARLVLVLFVVLVLLALLVFVLGACSQCCKITFKGHRYCTLVVQ